MVMLADPSLDVEENSLIPEIPLKLFSTNEVIPSSISLGVAPGYITETEMVLDSTNGKSCLFHISHGKIAHHSQNDYHHCSIKRVFYKL